jgi:hypothetical protein
MGGEVAKSVTMYRTACPKTEILYALYMNLEFESTRYENTHIESTMERRKDMNSSKTILL